MSGRSASVGGTLAGGVQDVAALLPLIGTEQCEIHVGSALEGGYLYAAATPLSIFGSLGIVKAGISILISSISISIPKITISFDSFKPTIKYSVDYKCFGARILKDAGFRLSGTVAPLIAMDGQRFKAETRLLEILEEKHINSPEKISVDWKSRKWNIMLVFTTILGAALSITPYIALVFGPNLWRPSGIHLPWLFPVLRIVGSCTATIACQLIMQSRVTSHMKNRILFMTIHQRLSVIYKEEMDTWLKHSRLEWNTDLPAERCLFNLEQYISRVGGRLTSQNSGHLSIPMATLPLNHTFLPKQPSLEQFSDPFSRAPSFDINDLHRLQQEHFPFRALHATFTTLSWIFLALSLPATVAGYIGCFTLVSATPSPGNGPLVWVGLEAALSILRIFIWASNPSFDEATEVTLGLELSEQQPEPVFTINDYDPDLTDLDIEEGKAFNLVPEREFLEAITPFRGPLDRFWKTSNLTLYFTLSYAYRMRWLADEAFDVPDEIFMERPAYGRLFITVLDVNTQVGVTFVSSNSSFSYFDVIVKYDTLSRKFQANVQSEKRDVHPWRIEDDNLFISLQKYYQYVVRAFNKRNISRYIPATVERLHWKWDLSQNSRPTNDEARKNNRFQNANLPSLTVENQLYLEREHEHQYKTELAETWSMWVFIDMAAIRTHARLDCYEALRDATSEKAKWELTELDVQLVWAWAKRELVVLTLSLELEDILRSKMESRISGVDGIGKDKESMMRMNEFGRGRRKRMEEERGAMTKRMQNAMKDADGQADREGRPWQDNLDFSPQWTKAIEFIDKQWLAGIIHQHIAFKEAEEELEEMIMAGEGERRCSNDDRFLFMEQFRKRVSHEHWRSQHELEERNMKAAIERIRVMPPDSARKDLDLAYDYPRPDYYATAKFTDLICSSSKGKACSAIVYEAWSCDEDEEAVCHVIANTTTRSVLNVDPKMLASIPPNDHLFFLSCKDAEGNFEEPALTFVQRNRERWWDQQTTNSSTLYFTPERVSPAGDSCYSDSNSITSHTRSIARILVFLTAPSAVRVSVLHYQPFKGINISIRHNGEVLASISNVPLTFQLDSFQPFMLQQGRHELELVPDVYNPMRFLHPINPYHLRDLLVELSDNPIA